MKQCSNCGNFVEDNAKFCTSCGQTITEPVYNQPQQPNYTQPQQPYYNQPQQPNYNQPQQPVYNPQPTYYNNNQMNPSTGKAVASLVLGILSFFLFGIVFSIIGYILGNSYLKDPRSNPAGFGMAKAGKICSLITMIIWIVVIVIYIILLITGVVLFNSSYSHYYY